MIDPTWLIIGFFFVVMLFLVVIGALVYPIPTTLKGILSELKKQNKHLRHGTATITTGELPVTDPDATAVNLPAITSPERARRNRELHAERSG